MFKDYDKFLKASLKVYLFLLVIIFIMKVVGLDYFGLDMNNAVILKLDNFVSKYHLVNVYYTFKGKTQTSKQWCDEYKISQTTLSDRLKRGWTLEQALTISTKGNNKKVY